MNSKFYLICTLLSNLFNSNKFTKILLNLSYLDRTKLI